MIKNGNINTANMKSLRFSRTDLTEELRLGGCDDIKQVKSAVVETNGRLSIILNKGDSPLTLKDAKKTEGKK